MLAADLPIRVVGVLITDGVLWFTLLLDRSSLRLDSARSSSLRTA